MRWWNNIMENVKDGVRSWLNIQPADGLQVNIRETLDFQGNAIKNKIWYRGDSGELSQLYGVIPSSRYTFWGAKSSEGMEINKIHTGLPALIVDTLANIAVTSLNDFEFKNKTDEDIWNEISKENEIKKKYSMAIKDVLSIGDGAFKVTFDETVSEYPIIEFYPGDEIEIKRNHGRIKEIVFKTSYDFKDKKYTLLESYGYGYIKYRLMHDKKEVPLNGIPQTAKLQNVAFSEYTEDEKGVVQSRGQYMLAVPVMFYESSKWKGRGQSIFDKKVDAFDSFDETWSQWMDALRAGRSKEYIPECLIPKDPTNGTLMKPNAFDNRYIQTDSNMNEGAKNEIVLRQPAIPHESYLATYITALDLCLQGIISPSTLGIDVKKLDNADAQREKEKTTLYTRDAIVDALTEDLKNLAIVSIRGYREFTSPDTAGDEIEVDVTFTEYANPSFESQIETIGKGKTNGVMSIEACVEELYGDTKDEEWKKEEIARLKAEQGIAVIEEPAVNQTAGSFQLEMKEGNQNDSQNSEQNMGDVKAEV